MHPRYRWNLAGTGCSKHGLDALAVDSTPKDVLDMLVVNSTPKKLDALLVETYIFFVAVILHFQGSELDTFGETMLVKQLDFLANPLTK